MICEGQGGGRQTQVEAEAFLTKVSANALSGNDLNTLKTERRLTGQDRSAVGEGGEGGAEGGMEAKGESTRGFESAKGVWV